MNKWLILLIVLILTGCGAQPLDAPQDASALITQWARYMEANDFTTAKSLMINVEPHWEESAKLGLAMAPWKSPRAVAIPADEQPFAPLGAVRMQWDLDVPTSAIYKLICSDVLVQNNKIRGLTRTFPCTSNGVYASGMEPLLFEEGDLPGTTFNVFGEFQVEKLRERGMPVGGINVSVNAKRSPTEQAPSYFINMFVVDPPTAEEIYTWWQGTASAPLADISGVGERAFGMETKVQTGTSRSVVFSRCNTVVQVEVVTATREIPIDFNVLKSAAEKIDQRVQPKVCIKP